MPSGLARVEEIVNEYAHDRAKVWATGIKGSSFQVLLAKTQRFDMKVTRGSPVNIILAWPQAQLNINTLLRDAFSLIRGKRLADSVELSNVMYTHTRGQSKKKWYREHYGIESELISDLIPQREIRVETVTETRVTVNIRDVITGALISKVDEHKTVVMNDGRVIGTKSWLELSRMAQELIESEPDPVLVHTDIMPHE